MSVRERVAVFDIDNAKQLVLHFPEKKLTGKHTIFISVIMSESKSFQNNKKQLSPRRHF